MVMDQLIRSELDPLSQQCHSIVTMLRKRKRFLYSYMSLFPFLHQQRIQRVSLSVCFTGKSPRAAGGLQERRFMQDGPVKIAP